MTPVALAALTKKLAGLSEVVSLGIIDPEFDAFFINLAGMHVPPR